MASAMLTGDKRSAPTRKSGMTVLGKVPKPINLPSQRLENHGLDPNVEIVPKGTLTWGSRPASTVPNVWTSSVLLSPNTDGSPGSPSHFDGRPSSGSGTRPSTAGSDKSHEPLSNAWGPNLRPSSASGSSVSNQSSIVSNRPRSAEARPSSSQLSRFAETPVESTVAWGPTRTNERTGPGSSKNNPITLTPENFPTLGSEKTSDSRGHSSHGRPGSSSGTTAMHKEAVRPLSSGNSNEDTHSDHGTVNSWKKDDYNNVASSPPNVNWHRDLQQTHSYTSGNIPPQLLGPWQSAHIQSPDGGWHRGLVGGPYRPSVLPGGYPMEPYVCYPQYSPASGPYRPSSEPVPKPGASPGGFYHPNNGDSYHHHQMADSYIVPNHPVIPVRPGMYPHPVPYESHYGPSSAGFHTPSEFGMPVRGIPNQGGAYDRVNLPDPEKLNVVRDGNASPTTKEQKESTHPHVTLPGQYKVLLKQHDNREDKSDTRDKREQSVLSSQPQLDRGVLTATSYGEEDRRRNHGKDDRMVYINLRPSQEASSQRDQRDSRSRDPVVPDFLVNSSTETDGSLMVNPENATFPVTKKNASLIEKLEVLNNKARSAIGHNKGDETKHSTISTKTDHSTSVITTSVASTGHALSSASHERVPCAGNANKISVVDSSKSSDLTALAFDKPGSSDSGEKTQPQVHKRAHVMRGRTDHPKPRSDSRGAEWVNKSAGSDTLVLVNTTNGQNAPGLQAPDSHAPHDAADMDHKAQRTKLKEIAMRRAKELQEQEEERTREQKAKALAKLEELNRRTAAQASNQKNSDLPPITEVPWKQEGAAREEKDNVLIKPEDSNMMTSVPSSGQNALPSNALRQKPDHEAGSAAKTDSIIVEAPAPLLAESLTLSVEINDVRAEDSVGSPSHVLISDSRDHAIPSSDLNEGNALKRKQTGSRKRSNIPKEENLSEKPTTDESTTSSGEVAILTSHGVSLPPENTTHHRKRSNRNAKNKSKMDEVVLSSMLPTKEGLEKLPTESSETQAQSTKALINQAATLSDQGQTQATDKLPAKMDSQRKPQSMKKSAKSQHVRTVERHEGVMWAPVRSSNPNEPSGEKAKKGTLENKIANRKNDHDEQIGTRTKRAEMERYVPKAVAKELSQQSLQEPLLPHEQAPGKLDSRFGNIVENPEMDTKDGDSNKFNKRGKASWRRRNSAEVPSQNYVEPSDQNLTTKAESQILYDDWNSNQNIPVPTEKIGVLARNTERRQQFVVQEHKDQRSKLDAKIFTQHPVSSLNETDRKNASRIKGSEQVRTQWQPKSHGDGGQRISFQEVPQNETRANDSFHQEANRGVQVLVDQPPRRQGHYNDRFSRGQETTYRGRVNAHLEYQPIGSHNRQGPMVGEEAHGGPHGSRYRERGQPYSRRGGGGYFYGQRGAAAIQAVDSCNSADWN